jgi:hypothetical protein
LSGGFAGFLIIMIFEPPVKARFVNLVEGSKLNRTSFDPTLIRLLMLNLTL